MAWALFSSRLQKKTISHRRSRTIQLRFQIFLSLKSNRLGIQEVISQISLDMIVDLRLNTSLNPGSLLISDLLVDNLVSFSGLKGLERSAITNHCLPPFTANIHFYLPFSFSAVRTTPHVYKFHTISTYHVKNHCLVSSVSLYDKSILVVRSFYSDCLRNCLRKRVPVPLENQSVLLIRFS